MSGAELHPAWLWARRELRAGLKGFRIFLACLILGVGAIAAVGSLSRAFIDGIAHQSRALLGGDVALALTHRPIAPAERAFIAGWGKISAVAEMQAMARPVASQERTIVELKSVDANYPLFGAATLAPALDLQSALAKRDGRWGALADPLLMDRLHIKVGDVVRIGAVEFQIRAALDNEPDSAAALYTLGPRVMIAAPALAETGLETLGSLIRYSYRIALIDPNEASLTHFIAAAEAQFPQAGWRITDRRNAAPRLKNLIDSITVFLTFVGLAALIVGGVGVGNAVRAFLATKTETIATLKCLGATPNQILALYLLQVLAFAALAVVIGLCLGALAPFALRDSLGDLFPVKIAPRLYPLALLEAAFYGFATALLFTIEPLARGRDLPPASLFRSLVAEQRPKLLVGVIATILAALALLAAAAIGFTQLHLFAASFVVGAAIVFGVLRWLGALLVRLSAKVPRGRLMTLRLALANLNRPGAPTATIVLSLGFGLTLLGALALIGANVHEQIANELPRNVPALFFVDIQKADAAAFDKLVLGEPGVTQLTRVANIRGRIVKVDGTPAEQVKPKPDSAWVLRGDQGLTYAAKLPEGSTIVAGKWWPPDYSGPPLVSLYAGAARGLGLKVGDTLTINVLGREITARIASLREIEWSRPGFNYVIVYSPGVLEAAPFTFVAFARTATSAAESMVYRKVTDAFPDISVVRSRDAIQSILNILSQLELGVSLTSLVALAAGALVLAGALAAGYRSRVYDSVILKVLGATRARILLSYLIEFGLLGLVLGAFAAAIASLISFLIIKFVMNETWVFLPASLAETLALAIVNTAGLGLIATFRALSERPAAVLRSL